MLIIENFLKKHHLDHLLTDLENRRSNSDLWRSNKGFWPDRLIQNFSGQVQIAPASYSVCQMLRTLINEKVYLRNYNFFNVQYTLWHKNSGLANHHDPNWGLAATLYLNQDWLKDWGGLLTWDEQCYVPKFNSIVINNQKKEHWVSEVLGDTVRITAQCWAK